MHPSPESARPDIPAASTHDTVDDIVRVARRKATPLRVEFLQRRDGARAAPGPLASFVSAGDHRGLLLYLLLLTKASGGEYEVGLAAAVWARALGLDDPTGRTATSTISKAWLRLERRNLIKRQRRNRRAEIQPLREDGSGLLYTHPGADRDRHLKLPVAFWAQGPSTAASGDDGVRWYETLSLPEVAMLLIALSLGDGFRLPHAQAPSWYGISADSTMRGLRGLLDKGLLVRELRYKSAPLAPAGVTAEHLYTLRPPFGPRGVAAKASRGSSGA